MSGYCGIRSNPSRFESRPEKSESSDEELITSLKSAHELVSFGSFDSLLVAGDFNMGNISWSEGSGFVSSRGSFKERFVETLDDCFLNQCVQETTFRKGLDDYIGSLLDLMITDSK